MNERLLEEIGLTKGEVRVYLTLLEIGETTTGKIIKKAQISSGKIYEILNKLMKKGLVSFIVKEKTKYFQASSPNRILDYMHEKEKNLKEKEQKLQKEIPLLLDLQKSTKKNYETKLYQGLRGIQTAIFEALDDLTSKDEVLAMGIMSSKKQLFNILWQKWHIERIRRKIVCKAIFSDKGTDYYRLFKKMKQTEVKVLKGITPSAIDIMRDRVLIFTYEDNPSCLMIINEEIARSFTTFFQTMWKIAKK